MNKPEKIKNPRNFGSQTIVNERYISKQLRLEAEKALEGEEDDLDLSWEIFGYNRVIKNRAAGAR
jgi:hypothetical protein